jgi:predicted AAA+ superfamily ATPase
MAFLILIIGIAIYISAERINEHKDKERESKVLQSLLCELSEVLRDSEENTKTTVDDEYT